MKKVELEKHKIYSNFLEDIVNDKNEKEFEDIDALQNRFRNLRKENQKLQDRKTQIYSDIEQTKLDERKKL